LFHSKNTGNAIFLARIFDFMFLVVQLNGRPGIGNQTSQVNFTLVKLSPSVVLNMTDVVGCKHNKFYVNSKKHESA
jgi:hypothetical protein